MRRLLALLAGILFILPSPARADAVDDALMDAFASFERARPQLASTEFGVDVAAYRDALTLGHFQSAHWGGGELALHIDRRPRAEGDCGRFAAYVPLPPLEGRATLVICPQFFESGTAELRRLTVLHELVHAVAGPDECRAMAFAARVETLATGSHTPVDRYWAANNCDGSGFTLP